MSGDVEKRFRETVEKLRLSILMAPDLADQERRLALLMVERIHRKTWIETGSLTSWLSIGTLAAVMQIDASRVKRLRRSLRDKGTIYVAEEGGRGPRSTAVYGFSLEWVQRIGSLLLITGQRHVWEGRRGHDAEAEREAAAAALATPGRVVQEATLSGAIRGAQETTLNGAKGGSTNPSRVVQEATHKGGSTSPPNLLSINPLNESLDLPPSLRSGGATDVARRQDNGGQRKQDQLASTWQFQQAVRAVQGLNSCPEDLKALEVIDMAWTFSPSEIDELMRWAGSMNLNGTALRSMLVRTRQWKEPGWDTDAPAGFDPAKLDSRAFADWLGRERKAMGITIETLGKASGFGIDGIQNIETGVAAATRAGQRRIASAVRSLSGDTA